MPQLIFTDFAPQLVWLVISFVALYVLMSRLALPRISSVLEERQNRIVDDLEKAEEMRREAEASLDAYESSMTDARNRARELTQAIRGETGDKSAEKLDELAAELARNVSDAEQQISARRDEALTNIQQIAAYAASAAMDRLIGVIPDEKMVDSAIKQALKERGKT
tara:strand:- start:184 stop:681 length:498 start_codon:yes stop_codon:yes gene_type:complete